MISVLYGDCTALLPTLAPASVQCVVTSPPYFGLRDFGLPPTAWPEIAYAPLTGVPPIVMPADECCLGLEESPLAYVAHLVHVCRLLRPVLRDDGVLWLNLGDSYAQPSKWGGRSGNMNRAADLGRYPRRRLRPEAGLKDKDLYGIPWRSVLALQADGWYLRADVIWEKPSGMPESVDDRPTRIHEYLFLLAKSEQYFYGAAAIREAVSGGAHSRGNGIHPKAAGAERAQSKQNASFSGSTCAVVATRNARTIWRIPSEKYAGAHYATFPRRLVERCILAGSRRGDTVLDPFGGTGTTGYVAEQHGRDAILIELNADYVAQIDRRTSGVQLASTELLS